MPAVTHQLVSVMDKPDSSMADIATVIQYDPVITASILKTCNSAFYGAKTPVESIKDAVNRLGVDKVVELALTTSGSKILSGRQAGYGLEEGEMWQYSVSSAVVAKDIAKKLGLKNRNTIFTAALLKDIGKVILEKYVKKEAQAISGLVGKKEFSFQEAEKKVLGIDHAELGAMIAKFWNFSPKMIKLIRHHHLSDEKKIQDKEVACVYLADCICMMVGIGVGADGLAYRFRETVMNGLKISASDITLIIAELGMKMQEIEEMLQMS